MRSIRDAQHRWQDLAGDLWVPPALVFSAKKPRRGGRASERFVQDDMHEIGSYLKLEEFDAEVASGGAKVTTANGSVVFVHRIDAELECVDENGGADVVKVFVCPVNSLVPILSALVNMPAAEMLLGTSLS